MASPVLEIKLAFTMRTMKYTTQNYAVTCIVLCTLLDTNNLTKSVRYMCRILIATLYVIRSMCILNQLYVSLSMGV